MFPCLGLTKRPKWDDFYEMGGVVHGLDLTDPH